MYEGTVFQHLVDAVSEQMLVFSDTGFAKQGWYPPNLKLCPRGTWNDRMMIESVLSMLTRFCHFKKVGHRVWSYFKSRVGWTMALFNILVQRLGELNSTSKPLLLNFRSDHCAPCVTQAHYLEQLEKKWNGNLTIQKIDTPTEPDKAHQYGVFTLSTTILVDSLGQVRQVNYGLTNSQKLSMQVAGMQMTSQ